MTKLDDHELEQWLSEFSIEYPDDEKIEQTIVKLQQYVPTKKKKQYPFINFVPEPLHNAIKNTSTKRFWIANLLYLMIGLGSIFLVGRDPYISLLFLGPIPVIIGIVDIFRSRDEGMIELELSFKNSPSHLMLAKLTNVGIYNIGCNILLIVILNIFTQPLILTDLLTYWAVPYTVSIAICLLLSIKFKTIFSAPTSIAILFTIMMSASKYMDAYGAIPLSFLGIALITAVIGIGYAASLIKKGVYHEFNN